MEVIRDLTVWDSTLCVNEINFQYIYSRGVEKSLSMNSC